MGNEMKEMCIAFMLFLIATCITTVKSASVDIKFDHIVDLDENFRLLWKVRDPDIIFEVQVRTHGYIGFGFSRSDYIYGSDIAIGWVDKHTFFQDRHIPVHSNTGEPVIDHSQDYILMSGFENSTHTVMRFRRKLITCDEKYDVPITNDTMKIVYMYHHDEPKKSSSLHQHGSLPHPEIALKPIKSLLLLQRPKFEKDFDESVEIFDVRVKNVFLTSNTTKACRALRFNHHRKSQIVAFRPLFHPLIAKDYVIHMMVYECQHHHHHHQTTASSSNYEENSCDNFQKLNCANIVATWSRGSQGFVYPDDVGYPLDDTSYFIEVHYEPFKVKSSSSPVIDNSGMQFTVTRKLRKHEAGLLSVGIQPAWTHIIPPGFRKVTSIGYCSGKCNRDAFSADGIKVFGLQMQTHEMGKSIKVGLVRDGIEHQPLGQDYNLNSEYLEYRSLDNHVRILPNDDLIVECSYNSYDKTKLTLGGFEAQQEVCQATLIYYPRQQQLTSCQSKPKTKNFLKSLNVEKLRNSQPFTIELPEKYAGKTLEEHLKTYNWKTEFDHFERVSKTSPIDIVCIGDIGDKKIVTDDPVSIKHPFNPFSSYCELHRLKDREYKVFTEDEYDKDVTGSSDSNSSTSDGSNTSSSSTNNIHNIQLARSKVLRSSELSNKLNFANNSARLHIHKWIRLVLLGSIFWTFMRKILD